MSILSGINRHEVLRFYERVNRIKPSAPVEARRGPSSTVLEISAEAKKKLVMEMAREEVLKKIRE